MRTISWLQMKYRRKAHVHCQHTRHSTHFALYIIFVCVNERSYWNYLKCQLLSALFDSAPEYAIDCARDENIGFMQEIDIEPRYTTTPKMQRRTTKRASKQ